jgi:putative transposase
MTKDTISETAALKALLSETADHQILAKMLGFVADRLMALDVDQLCGARAHERSPEGSAPGRGVIPTVARAERSLA